MSWLAFTSPWLLLGLAAAGLPVLIHFLTRARPRRVAFPPYQFLLEACAGRQAMHRLRTIILLTIRCLAVLALVLLFARPFLKPHAAASEVEAAKRVVIILDASLSMRLADHGVSLFSRAQAEAADVLRSLDSGSEAAVVLTGARPRPLLPALSRNISALHEELVKAKPTCEAGDPAAALALAAQMLGGKGTLHVFSDFQESNWKSVRELPGGVVCRLRSVSAPQAENAAIVSSRIVPASPVVGEPAQILCGVFNCSPRELKENVRLELGDISQNQIVTVPPYGTADAAFNVTFARDGVVTGKASIQTDDLPEDDTRSLAFNVHKNLQLLLISDADETDSRGPAFFISRAIAPSPGAAPGLGLVCRRPESADRGVLETADVFLLAAPAALSSETIDVISRRVNDGAQLIVFLDAPNGATLAPPQFSPPYLVRDLAAPDDGGTLAPGPKKPLADSDAADWVGMKFHRHYRTEIAQQHVGDVMLSYADGSAALAVAPVGKGMGAFMNIPLTPDGGDLIGSPLFPSLLHELLRSLRRGAGDQSATPGRDWVLDATANGAGPVEVIDPNGKPVLAKVVSSGRLTRLALPAPEVPGLYTVRQSGAIVAAGAVNLDPRESDLRPMALEAIQHLPGGANATLVRDEDELLGGFKTRPLWPDLALAAVAFVALEMILLAVWRAPRTVAAIPAARQTAVTTEAAR